MKKRTFLKWAIFLSIALSLLLGCSKKGVRTIEGDPELLYREGLARYNKRDYSEALKRFELLKSSFPDSPPYTVWAELKIGDCHFFQKKYVEAIAAYEEFKKIHPTHEEIPYVLYQIGMAYFNQMLTYDRDQTSTQKALSNFEYLVANYPPSLFTERTKEKIGLCRKRLADHEFYIGNYYYKNGKFKAASVRFQGLIEQFPKMPEEDKTFFLLGKSYLELDQGEKATEAFNKIVNEYPKSFHYKEAKAILDQGVKEKANPLRKTKTKESKKNEKAEAEAEPDRVYLVKFEEERRQPVSLAPPLPVASESFNLIPPKEEIKIVTPPLVGEPMQEDRAKAISSPPQETKLGVEIQPEVEKRIAALPIPSSIPPLQKEISSETKTEEEKKVVALPSTPITPLGKEKPQKEVLPEQREAKLLDTGQPIDITSDRVETYSKENLIIFKGNVMARQKDIVIYSDSLEAMVIEGGKGIERVVAGGNVKIQQGIRVANCQKAVFYNIDQKLVLTGDPKVWEGENMVSGDEIVFYIEQNRIEVNRGLGGRGKAKIYTGGEIEKLK
jgi:outer membrane protein assembly factor BamD